MNELKRANLSRAKTLFAGLSKFNLSVRTVLEGRSPGRVWIDNDQAPSVALLTSPEGHYVAGDCGAESSYASLEALIPFGAYLTVQPDGWGGKLEKIWSNRFAREHIRRHYRLAEMQLGDWRQCVPDGCRVAVVDAGLLGSEKKNVSKVLGWVENNWHSETDFLSNGFGFCMISGEAIVAWCLSDCVGGGRCEIGIKTDEGHRRRGLAALTVAALRRTDSWNRLMRQLAT
jgi:hypothetical protein